MAEEKQKNELPEYGSAATTPVSLSQALLAPLDAIFKAQIHAARSFLNLLLQIGYPHQPLGENAKPRADKGKPYNQEFYYEVEIDGRKETRKVSIPTLALVPVAPLAVDTASFKLEMKAEKIDRHEQIQKSEEQAVSEEQNYNRENRPWYLVAKPISIRGTLAAPATVESEERRSQSSTIQIEVNLTRLPMPSGLDKLLTSLTQTSHAVKSE